jgi:6-phosphofructokinase 2
VARAIKELGGNVVALYPVGGCIGQLLRQLVDERGIESRVISISDQTREDVTVAEEGTGLEYRFVLPGPQLSEREWRACLRELDALEEQARFVVVSGSLPRGVPKDFYRWVAEAGKAAGRRIVLDTSGPALRAALKTGVHLVKPSLRELQELVGGPLESERDWVTACSALVASGGAEIVALTLGERGAVLVTADRRLRAPAIPIRPVSTVGAGDSFLGAMVWALASGRPIEEAFSYGVAGGSAALLRHRTELCRREDVERLVREVRLQRV